MAKGDENKLLSWFDYIYYRTYGIYQKKWKESMPWLYALCVVSVIQSFTLLVIPIVYGMFAQTRLDEYGINKYYFGLFALIIVGLNYNRYKNKIPYSSMVEKWDKEGEELKRKKGLMVVFHIVFTFLLFFGLAIISGEINQGRM